jgi:transcription elongation factor GreA
MADQKKVPVTREGLERLRDELDELINVRRAQITRAIAEARSHGDLRENAAYDAARHDQMMNEKRISDLEGLMRSAEIVDPTDQPTDNTVRVGTTVIVDHDGFEERYTIVGAIEAKPKEGLISNESPIGQALLGRRPGDQAKVSTPGGESRLKIMRIER